MLTRMCIRTHVLILLKKFHTLNKNKTKLQRIIYQKRNNFQDFVRFQTK